MTEEFIAGQDIEGMDAEVHCKIGAISEEVIAR